MVRRFGSLAVNVPKLYDTQPVLWEFPFGLRFSREQLFVVVLVVIVTAALWALFRFARFGLATRAAAENEKGAVVLGFPGACLALFRAHPDARRVLHAVDAHPRAHNGELLRHFSRRRTWDEQGSFRLRIGPLSFAQFLAFSPDGGDFRVLVELTRTFVDVELDFDVLATARQDQRLIVYSPAPGSAAVSQLELLAVLGQETFTTRGEA